MRYDTKYNCWSSQINANRPVSYQQEVDVCSYIRTLLILERPQSKSPVEAALVVTYLVSNSSLLSMQWQLVDHAHFRHVTDKFLNSLVVLVVLSLLILSISAGLEFDHAAITESERWPCVDR